MAGSPVGKPGSARNSGPPPDTSIEKTVDGAATRDEGDRLTSDDRLRELYETYAYRVLAYAARRTDRDAARDVVSQTFLVACRRIDEVPAEPIAWLLGVAGKVLANERRATSRRSALSERVSLTRTEDGDPSEVVTDRIRALEALDRLGDWDREALMLMAWDRLDYKSAATVMSCSPSVFKIRLHRARRRLAEILDVHDPSDAERSLVAPRPQEAK